jgi:hypothetical protein
MLQTAIALLQELGVWSAIQVVVAVSVAAVLYYRFVNHS